MEQVNKRKTRGGRKMRRKSLVLATYQQCFFQVPFFFSCVPTPQSRPPENLKENNINEKFYVLVDSVIRNHKVNESL